ncbi:CPBP family intramembrane glutamic endopeptidase [Streptococcus oriscaviae]|uniref:CPBP family intramembrane metalloprotease n=1 Tax=Streptococcus oriscaviae TaxID=2781599 RepID=A0ABX7YJS0_9STRE|nr:type II CAAX endopeptidase family protein [Streptococcus oriscaviae]QUE54056.1 CPBP family intramembrane metalloprotease [Streptococcus oriscaviae]
MKIFTKVLWLLLVFMISQIWTFIMGFTMASSVLTNTPYDPNLLTEFIITASAIASIYLTWLIAKAAQIPLPKLKGWTVKDFAVVLGMTILTRVLVRVGIFSLQNMDIKSTANDAVLANMFTNFSFPLLFIIVAICGPILEEWTFRAGIIGYLFEKYPIIGVIISSLIFGAMHIPTNLISWGIYGGIGLVYSLVYYKTKRLELVMAMHILHNAAATFNL